MSILIVAIFLNVNLIANIFELGLDKEQISYITTDMDSSDCVTHILNYYIEYFLGRNMNLDIAYFNGPKFLHTYNIHEIYLAQKLLKSYSCNDEYCKKMF